MSSSQVFRLWRRRRFRECCLSQLVWRWIFGHAITCRRRWGSCTGFRSLNESTTNCARKSTSHCSVGRQRTSTACIAEARRRVSVVSYVVDRHKWELFTSSRAPTVRSVRSRSQLLSPELWTGEWHEDNNSSPSLPPHTKNSSLAPTPSRTSHSHPGNITYTNSIFTVRLYGHFSMTHVLSCAVLYVNIVTVNGTVQNSVREQTAGCPQHQHSAAVLHRPTSQRKNTSTDFKTATGLTTAHRHRSSVQRGF